MANAKSISKKGSLIPLWVWYQQSEKQKEVINKQIKR